MKTKYDNGQKKVYNLFALLILICSIILHFSCKKFVDIAPPPSSVNGENVFQDDQTAAAVLTGIYTSISNNNFNSTSVNIWTGLSSDELGLWWLQSPDYANYYQNKLSANTSNNVVIWTNTYPFIYRCNDAIAGLSSSKVLSQNVKQQLLGEAKFMRAFFYFQLVNLFGEVPLAITSDYKVNATLPRSPISEVYKQMTTDLIDAKSLLRTDYVNSSATETTTERVRPNKFAAMALLSRVYLYTKQYGLAESEATAIIENKSVYDTVNVENVFLKNNKETIWAIQPVRAGSNTADGSRMVLPSTGPSLNNAIFLNSWIGNSFEIGDRRKKAWTKTVTDGITSYYSSYKYKVNTLNQPVTEYFIFFRLAEQYLIRAEARAYLNKLPESRDDLNLIRKRAGLGNNMMDNQDNLITAILNERKVELFAEGHRWFDLKRTGNVDKVMSMITPLKGGIWKTDWQWYPIPNSERLVNDKLTQNAGYEN